MKTRYVLLIEDRETGEKAITFAGDTVKDATKTADEFCASCRGQYHVEVWLMTINTIKTLEVNTVPKAG